MAGMWRNLGREKVLALCGQGNSGGDVLAVAGRPLLLHPELDLRVVLLTEPGALSGDAQTNWRMLKAQDHDPLVASTPEAWRSVIPGIADSSVALDIALGTELIGPATGMVGRAIVDVNAGFRISRVIVLIPGGVGIAGEVEPVPGPMLAVLR